MLAALTIGLVSVSDSLTLPIGPRGFVELGSRAVVATSTGKAATLQDIVTSAAGKRFVYVGENHDDPEAHRWQAEIIGALVRAGRRVIVGLEMYQRHKQVFLDRWSLGKYEEAEFLEASDWKGQWGFDFGLYRQIFRVVKENGLRLVGLNVPRDWVRAVSRGGPDALPDEAKQQMPELFLGNHEHQMLFDALMMGHPDTGGKMYAGQVVWDEGMADTAIKYLQRTSVTDKTVFVILAGNGHVMYKQGINYRIMRRTGFDGVTIVTVSVPKSAQTVRVARGIADFVIGTPEPASTRQ
jgi:uncharacterized iron-regulated protein